VAVLLVFLVLHVSSCLSVGLHILPKEEETQSRIEVGVVAVVGVVVVVVVVMVVVVVVMVEATEMPVLIIRVI